jgi:hypothetical protein
MTDEEEFSARSQLKWTREGDAWILLYRRARGPGRPPPHVAISQSPQRKTHGHGSVAVVWVHQTQCYFLAS